eukprot:Partr_v1_DN24902_c1_g1_i1_m45418 putative NA
MSQHDLFANSSKGVVKRVVLTGGPCGGKSTVQTMLSDVFANLGWKVFRVPETATVLLSGGVNFAELCSEQAFQFQKDLLLVMLRMEQTFFNLAQSEADKGRDVIVICDRGAMDASAYIDKKDWSRLLDEIEIPQVEIRDERYDYVIHLVTAAEGAEEFYGLENNHTRSEGAAHARRLDKLGQNAWIGHPYFDIIDNSTDFEQKCHRVISIVLGRLGYPDRRFGENIRKHKYLVDVRAFEPFKSDNEFPVSYQDFSVEHLFLPPSSSGRNPRIRRRTQNGISHFNLTIPKKMDGESTAETRRSLSGREYDSLRLQGDKNRVAIIKRRRCFLWDNKYFQLDLFQDPASVNGMMILEAYLPARNSDNSMLPPFIPIEKEITGDSKYSLAVISLISKEGVDQMQVPLSP